VDSPVVVGEKAIELGGEGHGIIGLRIANC
jgi:hypothetical protein